MGLYPFQAAIVTWALRRGRAAIFADCGLGKTFMQLEWAKYVVDHTGKPVLILAPLAVGTQTQLEGDGKLGFDFLNIVFRTYNLQWMLLTKHPENWWHFLNEARKAAYVDFADSCDRIEAWMSDDRVPRNVSMGVFIDNQESAKQHMSELLKIPSIMRFVSIKPSRWFDVKGAKNIINQCISTNMSIFMNYPYQEITTQDDAKKFFVNLLD